MKIIVAHNFYQQAGGEDQVYRSEVALLRAAGHAVVPFEMRNDDVAGMGKLSLLRATIWNKAAHAQLRALVHAEQADVVHFHNTFPLMSPAAYYAAHAGGAAVVQTLHNFRLVCPGALFYRDGAACEQCLTKRIKWPAVKHKCYRESRATTAVTALATATHRLAGTWRAAVDAYIALTEFSREKFIAGGLPAGRVHVKPNFVHPDPGPRAGGGGYAIFVGRLSQEKGLETMLAAWNLLGGSVPLKIVGDGPLAPLVRAAAAKNPAIEWLGRKPSNEVHELLGSADLLVFPSRCYEMMPLVPIEAYAVGTPIVASGHGAMTSMVGGDGRLGAMFSPGDAAALANEVRRLIADRPTLRRMRSNVRAEFEAKYTGPCNEAMLIHIYQAAIARLHGSRHDADVSREQQGVTVPLTIGGGSVTS